MARASRTLLVSLAPAAVVAVAWLRVERPHGDLGRVAAVVALALAAALVRPLSARIAAILAAALLAGWTAFGLSPLAARPDTHDAFFGPLGARFGDGFLAFYDVRLPFDPRLHPDMASVVLAAVFGFALAVALAVAARRPVTATLLLLVGAGWPATLLGPSRALAVGVAILLASLALLAGLTPRRVPRAVVPAACLLAVLALVASGSPAVAKRGLVAWQGWDPYTRPPAPVSVSFVWNSQYLGLRWPRRRTTVLEVQAPQTASLYWRAAVLDDFRSSGWEQGTGRASDSLEPRAAANRRNQTEQVVTVKALADTRLVGGSVPVRFDAAGADLSEPLPGFAYLMSGLPRGFRYRVWSYAPQPTAAALARSRPDYPGVLVHDGLLDVYPGVTMPEFGARGREAVAARRLASHPEIGVFRPLARLAEEVGGGASSPYGAASALERWFRSTGGFRYADTVHALFPSPLVGFVTRTRAGYCQYFAGAMALMLRYLGVPARVAVGFSSGTYDARRHLWVVTDHDAHAWVEAWFAGYGWLPFDPTPPRGRPERGLLSAGYAASSAGPAAGARQGGRSGGEAPGQTGHRHGEEGTGVRPAAPRTFRVAEPASHALRDAVLFLVAVVLGAGVGSVVLTKLALRRARYVGRDPRRLAAACRRELADYLVDQRIESARSATLHELGVLVRRELSVDPDRFVAAATAARFGRIEGAAPAAREARRELRALVRAVRTRLTGRERLLGLLSLRSLGLSARAEVDASA